MVLPDGGALARRFDKLSTAKEVCFADTSKSTSLCPTSEVWRTRMLDWIGIEEKSIDRMGFGSLPARQRLLHTKYIPVLFSLIEYAECVGPTAL